MPGVLTLTETTHVTCAKYSLFFKYLLLLATVSILIRSVSLRLSASTSVSPFLHLSNQRQTNSVTVLVLIDRRLGA